MGLQRRAHQLQGEKCQWHPAEISGTSTIRFLVGRTRRDLRTVGRENTLDAAVTGEPKMVLFIIQERVRPGSIPQVSQYDFLSVFSEKLSW